MLIVKKKFSKLQKSSRRSFFYDSIDVTGRFAFVPKNFFCQHSQITFIVIQIKPSLAIVQ